MQYIVYTRVYLREMKKTPSITALAWALVTLATLVTAGFAGHAGKQATKTGVYEVRTEPVALPSLSLNLTLIKPVTLRNPVFLILFATGDGGWIGVSGDIFSHMAEQGYCIAAFNSRDIVASVKRSGKFIDIPGAAAIVDSIIVRSKDALGLPETTPVIVTGFSRGANLVVFTAAIKDLQRHLGGAVAVALTREHDFLQAPKEADRHPSVQVDNEGRIQTYPAIKLAGPIPFAVIQSKGDRYVPAEESRRLFGPDTPTRRLYEVDARNHGFGGGKEELMRDLDDALKWIEGAGQAR
jgi:hypothetical protein